MTNDRRNVVMFLGDRSKKGSLIEYELRDYFPVREFSVLYCESQNCKNCTDEIIEQAGGLEKIAIILVEDNLKKGTNGAEIITQFKKRGYTGLVVYCGNRGYFKLTKKEEKVFDHIFSALYIRDDMDMLIDSLERRGYLG
ncbi:MAG: hypothetical protein AABX11_01850 [Nanoarchaeota archaeon]